MYPLSTTLITCTPYQRPSLHVPLINDPHYMYPLSTTLITCTPYQRPSLHVPLINDPHYMYQYYILINICTHSCTVHTLYYIMPFLLSTYDGMFNLSKLIYSLFVSSSMATANTCSCNRGEAIWCCISI